MMSTTAPQPVTTPIPVQLSEPEFEAFMMGYPFKAGHPLEGSFVSVQVVKTEITPPLASADGLRGAETAPLPYGEQLHTQR